MMSRSSRGNAVTKCRMRMALKISNFRFPLRVPADPGVSKHGETHSPRLVRAGRVLQRPDRMAKLGRGKHPLSARAEARADAAGSRGARHRRPGRGYPQIPAARDQVSGTRYRARIRRPRRPDPRHHQGPAVSRRVVRPRLHDRGARTHAGRVPDGRGGVSGAPAGRRLGRLGAGSLRAAKIAATIVVLALIGRSIARNWAAFPSVHVTLDIRIGWLVASVATVFITYAIQIESWRRMLRGWEQRLPFTGAARAWCLANLGRYIPGKVWSVAGLVVLAERAGIRRSAAAISAFAMQAVVLGT